MKIDLRINNFDCYVSRSPILSTFYYEKLINKTDEYLFSIFYELEKPLIKEAILTASPDLYYKCNSCIKNPNKFSLDKKKELAFSLLRYLIRMSTRSTPFGIFAGCSVGQFANSTNLILSNTDSYTKHSNIDYQLWHKILYKYKDNRHLREQILYYPNNSLYRIGNEYRYIEYSLNGLKREYKISGFYSNNLIESILKTAKNGSSIFEIITKIISKENEKDEALSFIHSLIDNQILISELEPNTTGALNWENLVEALKEIPVLKHDANQIEQIFTLLNQFDESIVDELGFRNQITDILKKLNIEFNEKYLIQTDLNISTIKNQIQRNIPKQVSKAIQFVNEITPTYNNSEMEQFKKEFLKRYETREMPLTLVLDSEAGIGYGKTKYNTDSNPYLEKFRFLLNQNREERNEKWTSFIDVLENKLKDAEKNQSSKIVLYRKDFQIKEKQSVFQSTFSAMVELIKEDNKEKIHIQSAGGTSATQLIGRFTDSDQKIQNLFKKVVEKEEHHYQGKILAEIVHIPEARTGNILRRPSLRKYEIPYLAKPFVKNEHVINVKDLYVKIKNNRIVLWSKLHNKEVIPYLSNAHNYSINSLPIYHFLCDLQYENYNTNFNFSWSILKNHYNYFPRVEYENVILEKEQWKVSKSELTSAYLKVAKNGTFHVWREKRKIPELVFWVRGDNKLLLDFSKQVCIDLFLDSVRKFESIWLEEAFDLESSIVQNEQGESFAHQIIIPFYSA